MKIKLLTYLQNLDENEWKIFRQYLYQNAQSTNESNRLFELIYQQRKSGLSEDWVNGILIKHFGSLSRKSFFNLLSKILKSLETWISLEGFKKDSFRNKLYLLKSLNQKAIYKEADKLFYQLEKELNTQEEIDISTKGKLYELYEAQFLSSNPIKYKRGNEILSSWFEAHTEGYKERSLYLSSLLHNWEQLKNENYQPLINLLKASSRSIKSSKTAELLELLELMIREDNAAAFIKLKQTLIDDKMVSQDSLLHEVVLSFLSVRFGKLWDQGLFKDGSIMIDIYNYYLTQEIKKRQKSIARQSFLNMCNLISVFTSYEETDKFIETWIGLVGTNQKDEFQKLLHATNLFYHEQYDSFLIQLPLIKTENKNEKIQLYRMEIGAMYKLRHIMPDVLFSRLLNFKRFLHRNEVNISKRLFDGTRNYIRVFEKLLKKDFKSTEIDLDQYKVLSMRTWLEKQLK